MSKCIILFLLIVLPVSLLSQISSLPVGQQIDWSIAGIPGGIPNYPIGSSVMDFGAVGDGVTDDRLAFQQAINAAPENTTIFVPAGNYLIKSTIYITRPRVILRGECPSNATKLNFEFSSSGKSCFAINIANNGQAVAVTNAALPKGIKVLQVTNATGFSVGKYAELFQ